MVGAASAPLLTSAITSAIDESRHDQHFPQIGHILAGPLLVPQSWFAEAATYLYSLENARDLSEIGAQKISNILSALNFEVDDGVGATLPRYRELAKKHKLPANLIIYLELAKRRNATLYTTNISLRKAADREGITRP